MIKINNISAGYGQKRVLNDISLEFTEGEFTFILGQNGAGKSTLLKTMNGILQVECGEVELVGSGQWAVGKEEMLSIKDWDEKALAREIAFIPQEFFMQFDYTVYELCLFGRYPYLNIWGNYSDEDNQITMKYIEKLGLLDFKDRYYNQLSGGEKQRVLIARALVQEARYILCDESLSHLDINHQIEILHLLQDINKQEGKTIIMVSHNLNLASEFADRIIVLKDGFVLANGVAEEVFTESVLSEAFDLQMSMIVNPFTGKKNIVMGKR